MGTALGGLRQLITIVFPRRAKRVGEGETNKHYFDSFEHIV